jgi:thioesterase domain-containing protein
LLPNDLENYLHSHIPLSKAMQVAVVKIDSDSVVLSAPLAPNTNHQDTIFGGSASAVAILAAWSLLNTRLLREGFQSRLVIQRNTMEYDLPIAGDFTAHAMLQDPAQWEPFLRMLKRKGKARTTVVSVLEFEGRKVGHFVGEFVAIKTGKN